MRSSDVPRAQSKAGIKSEFAAHSSSPSVLTGSVNIKEFVQPEERLAEVREGERRGLFRVAAIIGFPPVV